MLGGASRAIAFYNYGRKHFNRKGWLASERLKVDTDLTGRVYAVSGSNSGIGYCLVEHLYKHGARVYMICRNEERARTARQKIIDANQDVKNEEQLKIIIADCSLKSDVEKAVKELSSQEESLDALVCNAGALLDKKRMTDDGVETTFACHFLFGTYWLGKLCLPLLEKASDPRLVIVTSGGMYNEKLRSFNDLKDPKSFDGQLAYAKAKRAQVVLGEEWAKEYPKVKVVSSHPGWCLTPGVTAVYGSFGQWLLSPLRSLWEGTEGMAWLCTCPGSEIESGAIYIDGKVEPKHLHKSSEYTQDQVDQFMNETNLFFSDLAKNEKTEQVAKIEDTRISEQTAAVST